MFFNYFFLDVFLLIIGNAIAVFETENFRKFAQYCNSFAIDI